MRQLLLDIVSAAEIMGVDNSTVAGWCKNKIINCQSAPDEYSDKTKYLIDEAECNYISGLIKKYGTRMALLNYKKDWRGTVKKEEKKEEMVDCIPWILDLDVVKEEPINESVKQEPEPIKEEEHSDKLVESIIYAHSLKLKIAEQTLLIKKLLKEYDDIKHVIVEQI